MARKDWRKYYVITFSDGTCSPYFYRDLLYLRELTIVSNAARRVRGRRISGIMHVKGRGAGVQNAIYARVIDKAARGAGYQPSSSQQKE